MKPFVKWAGGKRQILDLILKFINDSIEKDYKNFRYIEPFLGGGAVFFALKPEKAIIGDLNEDLINAYKVIASDKYLELMDLLDDHKEKYLSDGDEHYYEVRRQDRDPKEFKKMSSVEKAARMIFLNKTCYNGLYRVNSKGEFNTPMGRYKNPSLYERQNIIEIHEYFSTHKITILNASYEETIKRARGGDIIYIDPPYDYDDDDGFTKYQMKGFTFDDFKNLKSCCDSALEKGCFVIISNNETDRVIELFGDDPRYRIVYYDIYRVNTNRNINSDGAKRRTGREVVIWGMNSNIPFPQANEMEKIIKLLTFVPNENEDVNLILKNKVLAQEVLGVSSERQVAYYASALKYLRLLNSCNEFNDEAISLNHDEEKIKKYIFNFLYSTPIFKKFYDKKVYEDRTEINMKEVSDLINKPKNTRLSKTTIKRRLSTVSSWVDWMFEYKNMIFTMSNEEDNGEKVDN